MREISVLWVDDDFGGETNLSWKLDQLKLKLESELRARGIAISLRTSRSGAILDDIVLGRFDLLLLDVELNRTEHNASAPSSGFEVLERLARVAISPPVVLVTRHFASTEGRDDGRFTESFEANRKRYLRAFPKDSSGIQRLSEFIEEMLSRPGFTMVVMSDLHAGHISINEKADSFETSLIDEVTSLGRSTRVDYLVVTGDFAWKSQKDDLPRAASLVNQLRGLLGTTSEHQFHFCAGNHDVALTSEEPWVYFHSFVKQLGASDRELLRRYYSYQSKAETLSPFVDRRSTLAVARGKHDSVLFAALNSCKLTRSKRVVHVEPEVGEEQWTALRRLLANEPSDQLRIAILHHPIFAAPGGDWPDERPLHDQAQALHQLSKMGFQFVLHGHTHFSALYEHRVAVLNDSRRGSAASSLLVIACPTTGAEPSVATPHRQYLIVNVGHHNRETDSRTVTVRTRVYSHVDRSWLDGGAVADGVFRL